eukprot:TRINITY_DN58376_c0_g1_i1.p1 TRINITY_DN58376_c0_g1~~TRINITY_DN58376_c0_g1_i1.p1  ORF type:complete len:325 (-),score=26.15 TRINITY_DN58376_c0_g1_i1:76-1050(-)
MPRALYPRTDAKVVPNCSSCQSSGPQVRSASHAVDLTPFAENNAEARRPATVEAPREKLHVSETVDADLLPLVSSAFHVPPCNVHRFVVALAAPVHHCEDQLTVCVAGLPATHVEYFPCSPGITLAVATASAAFLPGPHDMVQVRRMVETQITKEPKPANNEPSNKPLTTAEKLQALRRSTIALDYQLSALQEESQTYMASISHFFKKHQRVSTCSNDQATVVHYAVCRDEQLRKTTPKAESTTELTSLREENRPCLAPEGERAGGKSSDVSREKLYRKLDLKSDLAQTRDEKAPGAEQIHSAEHFRSTLQKRRQEVLALFGEG